MERLKDIALFVKRLLITYGFRTKQLNYSYPVTTEENSIMNAIEDILYFNNRSGYIVMASRDGFEFISGNDYTLAISWDGSRPNVNYLELPIPDIKESHLNTLKLLDMGGGYNRYEWIDPTRVIFQYVEQENYVTPFDDYLFIGAVYQLGSTNVRVGSSNMDILLGDTSKAYIMIDVISQLIGNFLMYNDKFQSRYDKLFKSLEIAEPNIFMLDPSGKFIIPGNITPQQVASIIDLVSTKGGGYIQRNPDIFVTQVPYYQLIVGYID